MLSNPMNIKGIITHWSSNDKPRSFRDNTLIATRERSIKMY